MDYAEPLADILSPGLAVVFCGINPGMRASATGHHFAGRNNRFWQVLHLAGITPTMMRPEDDRNLLMHGYGLTTAVARPTARADQLSPAEMIDAIGTLEEKIRYYTPGYVAFLGKAAYAA